MSLLFSSCGSLFVLLFFTLGQSIDVYPHVLQPMHTPCNETNDCLSLYNFTWCHSGLTCLHSFCYRLPAYPCDHTEQCQEEEHQCIKKSCHKRSDCDDGLFCNGAEQCVAHRCMPDYRTGCFHGICNEDSKTCTTPISLKMERASFNQRMYLTKSANRERNETQSLSLVNNYSSHVKDHGTSELNTSVNFAIICAVSVVAVVILILLIIAIVGR